MKKEKRKQPAFAAIDMKSFFASVECQERGLDALTTNLVVADTSRTEKTICLAISPALKAYGLPGRARLFEVVQKVKEINLQRAARAPQRQLAGASANSIELAGNPALALDFIIATPRMSFYLDYSRRIYDTYLEFVAPEDIFAYSIDEVFCDITHYLTYNSMTAKDFVSTMVSKVYYETGLTATAGIGTNMFLAKVAMDILAKHAEPNAAGTRIAELDEISFRKELWDHTPLTDFWRVGHGYAKRLRPYGIHTMGDIARCSLKNEDFLYQLFGVNAELLIDHSWGHEPTTIQDVKNYQPEARSLSSGQVMHNPYNYQKSTLIVKEMAELLALEMLEKGFTTDQLVLHLNYDVTSLNLATEYAGTKVFDHYGRLAPKPAHGTLRLPERTASIAQIREGFSQLFAQIVDKNLLIRKFNLCVANLDCSRQKTTSSRSQLEQTDLFTDYHALAQQELHQQQFLEKENEIQKAVISIRHKFGKNAIIKGMNLEQGGTTIERNHQIGGHKA